MKENTTEKTPTELTKERRRRADLITRAKKVGYANQMPSIPRWGSTGMKGYEKRMRNWEHDLVKMEPPKIQEEEDGALSTDDNIVHSTN